MKVFLKKIIEYLFYNPEKSQQKILRKYQEELKDEREKTKKTEELLEKSKKEVKELQEELAMLEVQEKKEKGVNPFKLVK